LIAVPCTRFDRRLSCGHLFYIFGPMLPIRRAKIDNIALHKRFAEIHLNRFLRDALHRIRKLRGFVRWNQVELGHFAPVLNGNRFRK